MTTQHSPPTHSIVLQGRNERKDGQLQKIITEIERIITKIEEVEIERMLIDTRHPKKFEMMKDMLGY